MADIYGKLTEHPEVPIEDAGRFTVEIKYHEFEPRRAGTTRSDKALNANFCARCGYNRVAPVHPKENA